MDSWIGPIGTIALEAVATTAVNAVKENVFRILVSPQSILVLASIPIPHTPQERETRSLEKRTNDKKFEKIMTTSRQRMMERDYHR
jgi:hypothetical protein